ncbi:hypothetical protein DDK22_25740 [Cupriavidus necator]|uniref:2,6-dihydroxypyridine 3-monooxygenase substrate binding domain-containing protein n=3 Tax=Cupriavidus necator TaxID=106590 RepID=A0A367PDL9_CUPNE|nr:hypothetical protein DDK22_25740 [Cupriavidus necator]
MDSQLQIHLDRTAKLSLSEQIHMSIARAIESGLFAPGTRLPSAPTARARLLPAVRPAYSGYVAWRGTLPDASLDPAIAAVFAEAITYNVCANSLILLYPHPRAGWFGRARRAAAQIRLVP